MILLYLGALLFALLLSALSSGSETGLYCIDRVRLRVATERGERAAQRLERLLRRPEDVVITMLLTTNIADYLATAAVTALLLHLAVSTAVVELYATAICTPLILVFGGLIPKDWFRRESNALLARLSVLLVGAEHLARITGLVWFLRGLTTLLARWLDPAQAVPEHELLPRARLLHLLREGAARGGLTVLQRDLIERVLNLPGVRVSDVMIRLPRAATVPRDIERAEFLRIARMAHFSRLPVWVQQPRRIVGVVPVFDVLSDTEERPIAAHVRPLATLAESLPVSAALLELQQQRQTMAVVVDRSGLAVGILTVKDLVEEVVGELEAW
ncbi:MAG: DUF21 domain-containing protein [Phycisphaerales bacterium]|nr:DUF21 domain-containing protein [Phycisphaerales bacterium]